MCGRKLKTLLLVFFFSLLGLAWGQSYSSDEEMKAIILELEQINSQQSDLLKKQEQTILELQKSNSEKQTIIEDLQTQNKEKQMVLNQQLLTIDLLKNSIEDQQNSYREQKFYWVLSDVCCVMVGFGFGRLTVRIK